MYGFQSVVRVPAAPLVVRKKFLSDTRVVLDSINFNTIQHSN